MIFVGGKTIEKVLVFKDMSTLHMMKYPGMQHDITETNGIVLVRRQALFNQFGYRLAADEATPIGFGRETVLPIANIDNRPQGTP